MDKGLRILILEDVPADAELMERELRRAGFGFSSKLVDTREDFLKELKDFAPDIILSDYMLPHFDGMAALEITKELAPTIPFIIVTGSMNEETAVECMKAGAADYVIKDHLARIGPAVEGALENKRVREEKARLEEALWTAAREWRATFDALNDPLALMDPEGKIRRCNKAMANLLGKGLTEIIGRNCCEIVHGVSGPIEGCPVARLRETRRRETLVLSVGDRWFNTVADPLLDENGNLIGAVHIMFDFTERKRAEEALRVTHRFLEIANRHTAMNPLLNEFVAELQKFTQCDAVGIRILDKEGNIPYQAYKGFNQRFYESESPLSIKSDQCMCINVIKGVTDPKLSFYSEGGSFYMNGTTRFLATVSEEEKGQTRNVCNQVGYESVALVPIRLGDRILGLIHVADPYENMVPLETVETLEQVAMQMGEVIERLQAEEALRESEKRYRQVIENATEIIYSLDKKGNFIYGNPACLKATGFSLEELRQYNYQDLIVPEHQKKLTEIYIKQFRERQAKTYEEFPFFNKSGEVVWFAQNASLVIEDGEVVGFHIIARDITERKRAEEALKESEERYRTAIEHSNDGVAITKGSFHLYVNKKFLEIFGYNHPEEILGKPLSVTVHPDDSEHIVEISLKRQRGEDVPSRYEFKGIRKDGGIVYIEVSATKTIYRGEAVSLAYLRDITERKRVEEEKAALQEQLRQSQKMEAIGQLAGGVAHDFNNLLTIIKGNSELSLMDLEKNDPLRGNLEGVLRASGRASGLIRQLLAFSRRQVMEMKVLDLNTVLEDLDKMLRRIIGEDIELVILPSKDLQRIKADAGQIEQVILNLAVNSRDAMPSGGRLTIETANGELDEEYARRHVAVIPGRYVMLSVSDTGGGE